MSDAITFMHVDALVGTLGSPAAKGFGESLVLYQWSRFSKQSGGACSRSCCRRCFSLGGCISAAWHLLRAGI